MRYEEFVRKIMEEFTGDGRNKGMEFPGVDLYVDQAASFLNSKLASFDADNKDEIITKGMISNYTKHGIIPRPVDKKYSREHLLFLNMVYYLKGMFQMNEIQRLMKPMIKNYNSEFDEKIDLMAVCQIIEELQNSERKDTEKKLWEDIERLKAELGENGMWDDDLLEIFMIIMILAIRADAQKYLAKRLLNEYFPKQEGKRKE
ncbi:MAG: DUF1836 domain-containing protein [Anaerovoracaceae bacterium]|jgi:hypothetical protein